jgi:hypothetical protein
MKLLGFLRRISEEPWFKVMAAVGADERQLIPIGKTRAFTAQTNGATYWFVNDAYGAYENNHGTATVTIECLD